MIILFCISFSYSFLLSFFFPFFPLVLPNSAQNIYLQQKLVKIGSVSVCLVANR
uniref:Uncharacterized protein n=1 Tax=Rhizophora mucronata TaxID=61149 RepID=A0A2P2J3N5_RHIMU